ncbi:MAG: TRAP transporter small permease subunit [Pseudomonadota bacterium]
MSALIALLKSVNTAIGHLVTILSSLIIAIMVAALTGSAVTRYFSGTGYDWLIELPPALVPWLVFPLLGPLFRAGEHVSVDLLPTFLSGRALIGLRAFGALVTLIGAIIFLLAGVEATGMFRMLGQIMELEIEIPIWWMYLAFPTGFAILASFALEALLIAVQDLFRHSPQTEGQEA